MGGTAGIGPDAGMPGTAGRAGSGTQVPVAIGVHTAVAVSHFWSCEVRRLIWIVVFISGVEYSLATWVVMSTVPIVPAMSMPASGSANQMLPSGPALVMRPIWLGTKPPLNHSAPSPPWAMLPPSSAGVTPEAAAEYEVTI